MPHGPDHPDRRQLIAAGGAGLAVAAFGTAAFAETVDLRLPGGPSRRPLTTAFPGKGTMVLQRTRPPLLETPMEAFNTGVFTPNEKFFVRWHMAVIPTSVDVNSFRLAIHGHVGRPLSLSLADILAMPRIELAAVNQCSGNSRGMFTPRVPGAQWGNGAMGNALWMGVPLRHLLDLAGVKAGATGVRFKGLDQPVAADAPTFAKSIGVDHARDGEVMVAFAMNGEQLPLLNGFPLRLVVPGWYSTYWVKMLNDIEVMTEADDNYWMAKAYRIPTTPMANVKPGESGFPTVPINRMVPRAFVTNLKPGVSQPFHTTLPVGGIAMGGDCGVAKVELSADGGRSWTAARLGPDQGKYGFRRFDGEVKPAARGPLTVLARCTNAKGQVQPLTQNWNPSGFMRGGVEAMQVVLT